MPLTMKMSLVLSVLVVSVLVVSNSSHAQNHSAQRTISFFDLSFCEHSLYAPKEEANLALFSTEDEEAGENETAAETTLLLTIAAHNIVAQQLAEIEKLREMSPKTPKDFQALGEFGYSPDQSPSDRKTFYRRLQLIHDILAYRKYFFLAVLTLDSRYYSPTEHVRRNSEFLNVPANWALKRLGKEKKSQSRRTAPAETLGEAVTTDSMKAILNNPLALKRYQESVLRHRDLPLVGHDIEGGPTLMLRMRRSIQSNDLPAGLRSFLNGYLEFLVQTELPPLAGKYSLDPWLVEYQMD